MKSKMHRLPALVMTMVMACVVINILSAKDNWDKKAAREKADYLFIESQGAYATGDYAHSVMTLRRAFDLDSTDVEIAAEWAYMRLLLDDDMDSVQTERDYLRLRRRFIANPRNYFNGQILAAVAQKMMKFDDVEMVWSVLEKLYPNRMEPTTELAQTYLKMYLIGDSTALEKALDAYDRIEAARGINVESSIQKVSAYIISEDTAAVIRELRTLYNSAPGDAYTNYAIGYAYNLLDMPDSAFVYFDNACAVDSTFGPAYMSRAQIYLERGDTLSYGMQLKNALRSTDIDEDQKLQVLKSYVDLFYVDSVPNPELEQIYTDLQTMYPTNSFYYDLYGLYLIDRERYNDAEEQFLSSMMVDSTNEDAVMQYIRTAILANDTIKAIDMALDATPKFPSNFYYPVIAATYYNSMGKKDKALEVIDAVEIQEVYNEKAVSTFLSTKADIHAAAGDTIGALEIYDKAIELNPGNTLALNNAAYFITLSGGDLDKAARYSIWSLKDNDLNPTFLDTYAWVLFHKKDYALARQFIDMALNAYRTDGDSDVPADDPTEYLDVDEGSADIFDHAGDIYFMNGDRDMAVKFWQKALELDPKDELIAKKVKHKTIFFR